MKKTLFFLFCSASMLFYGQSAEKSPTAANNVNLEVAQSPASTSFLYDIGTNIGAQGNAAVIKIGNAYWVSAWASAVINVLDNTGNFVESFTIPTVSGARSFTTDGTNVYVSNNTNTIYKVNPTTRAVIGTISVPSGSIGGNAVRFVTYDSSLNSGAGGFWLGNFNTALYAVSMTGTALSNIPAATHGITGMYGAAVDSQSHRIYVYAQMGTSLDNIYRVNLQNGVTESSYDVFTNDLSGVGTESSIAGGIYLSTHLGASNPMLIGVSQATPSNYMFGLLVDGNLTTSGNAISKDMMVYPNPVADVINFKNSEEITKATLMNITGQKVLETTQVSNGISVAKLPKGSYIIKVEMKNGNSVVKQLIKK